MSLSQREGIALIVTSSKADKRKKYSAVYFYRINMHAVFSEDSLYFTDEKGMSC